MSSGLRLGVYKVAWAVVGIWMLHGKCWAHSRMGSLKVNSGLSSVANLHGKTHEVKSIGLPSDAYNVAWAVVAAWLVSCSCWQPNWYGAG